MSGNANGASPSDKAVSSCVIHAEATNAATGFTDVTWIMLASSDIIDGQPNNLHASLREALRPYSLSATPGSGPNVQQRTRSERLQRKTFWILLVSPSGVSP